MRRVSLAVQTMHSLLMLFLVPTMFVASVALAQSGLPRGADDVLLARVYRKSPAGIAAIGRMGLVPSGKSVSQALQLPASEGWPSLTFGLTVERKGDGARGKWELLGVGSASRTGRVDVVPGALNRVSLMTTADGELFASIEGGRASAFEVGKLAQHFGALPWGMPPPGATAWAAPQSGAAGAPMMMTAQVAPVATRPASKGPSMELQCAGGATFALSLDSGRGECRTRFDDGGSALGATCDDRDGNAAEADCSVGRGRGACVRTAGSGSCRAIAAVAGPR